MKWNTKFWLFRFSIFFIIIFLMTGANWIVAASIALVVSLLMDKQESYSKGHRDGKSELLTKSEPENNKITLTREKKENLQKLVIGALEEAKEELDAEELEFKNEKY